VPAADSTTAIEAAYRIEFPRLVAVLAAFTGDISLAEDLAQDALTDALRQWPRDGTPNNPGAWLTAVGKRKAIDAFRRQRRLATKYAQIGRDLPTTSALENPDDPALGELSGEAIDDDRIRLIFVACHPILSRPARVALTLRLIGGLTVPEIARAYLVAESTMAQRIGRAKKSIARAGIPFEVPEGEDRLSRLRAVLEVIYLIFNEGYSATSGEDWVRPDLCGEALRLGRVLAALVPEEPEVHGLVALMEFQSSRLRARIGPTGAPVLLLDQDRRRWDRLHIGRGEAALARADELETSRGPYTLQAAIAACHARSFRPEETDWDEIVDLYTQLARITSSPIVELNRAVAVCARRVRLRRWPWWTSSSPRARSSGTTCFTACGVTCSTGSAATARRPPRSTRRRPWPPTVRSALFCATAPGPAAQPARPVRPWADGRQPHGDVFALPVVLFQLTIRRKPTQVTDQMGAQVPRIIAHSVDERRFPAAQEGGTEQIQARNRRHPAVMADPVFAVENWHLQPRVVRPIPGRPHHGPDLARTQRQKQSRRGRHPGWRRTPGRLDLSVEAAAQGPLIEGVQKSAELQVGERTLIGQ
jgi:RNA polymerase sigma factor (sigma-70 family)